MAIHEGDKVAYTDREGTTWEATITKYWSQDCVNLSTYSEANQHPTSVPRKREGMSGYYFEEMDVPEEINFEGVE